MKTNKNIKLRTIVIMVLLVRGFFGHLNAPAQGQANSPDTNSTKVSAGANLPPPPPGFASHSDYLKSLTTDAEAISAYRNGLISADEELRLHFQIENAKPQDFYGRIVDQYGQPVIGAGVIGNIAFEFGWTAPEKFEQYKTQTDEAGLFEFTGLHGAKLGIVPSKPGFELGGHGEGYKPSVGIQSSPTDRVTFTMWKLRGAEAMIHNQFQFRIPYDGTAASIDLATGKKGVDGDLRITLSRSPLKIHRGSDKYDWTVKIEAINGGLVAENDPYPYWAPENGYQAAFEANMTSNTVPWSGSLQQNFYTKNAQGRYGRIYIDLATDSMRPDTGVTIQTWINPSGSRNLEFDPKKQIR